MKKVSYIVDTASWYCHEARVDKCWLRRAFNGSRYGYRITQFERKTFPDGTPYTTAILSHYGPNEENCPGIPIELQAWIER